MSPISPKDVSEGEVPVPGDPERKRMLNVLAQRRYRKRKRERMAALEAQLKNAGKAGSVKSPADTVGESPISESTSDNAASSVSTHESDEHPEPSTASYSFSPSAIVSTSDWQPLQGIDSLPTFDEIGPFDPFSSAGGFDFNTFLNEDTSTRIASPGPRRSIMSPSSRQTVIANDVMMEMPLMKLHRIGLALAEMLGCTQQIFDPSVSRVLLPLSDPRVPSWLQPTIAQQTIPHHPFIDILPWPSVRTKLLIMLSQPAHLRPLAAQDEHSILRLMSDTDAETEGCRVTGEGFDCDDWEVGQSFFSNWWWALDPHIVSLSNERRVRRGDTRLQLTAS